MTVQFWFFLVNCHYEFTDINVKRFALCASCLLKLQECKIGRQEILKIHKDEYREG